MAKVAVVRYWYLPVSETFIYGELVHLSHVTAIVCAKKLINLDRFPFEPIYPFQSLDDLSATLRNQNVDLIHARFGLTGADLLDVKGELGLPMLTSFHGFDLPTHLASRRRYGERLQRLFAQGEAFTATSREMKRTMVRFGCPEEKIVVHHSGIDVRRFSFRPRTLPASGDVTVLSVGRLVEKKGTEYLIDAFHRVQERYPLARLRIAGDGPRADSLRERVMTLRLEEKVAFLGEISHDRVVEEMQRADLFALACTTARNGDQEGIPNVLKEAMACGLPVVSTRHAGIPELVVDGESGFLVPERDADALADRLVQLIENSAGWGEMGRRGRETVVRSFDVAKQTAELESIYAAVLRGTVARIAGDDDTGP